MSALFYSTQVEQDLFDAGYLARAKAVVAALKKSARAAVKKKPAIEA